LPNNIPNNILLLIEGDKVLLEENRIIEEKIKNIEAKLRELELLLEELQEIKEIEITYNKLRTEESLKDSLLMTNLSMEKSKIVIENNINEMDNRIGEILDEIKKYNEQRDNIIKNNKLNSSIELIKNEIENKNSKYKDLNKLLINLNISVSGLEDKEKEYDNLNREIDEVSIKHEFYKKLSDITGSSGISIYILEQKLNELNEKLNSILEEQINKKIILYRKSSGIDIKIQLPTEEIYTLGGTESLLIDIAIKIIASKLSLMPRANVLFIDESISVFDINKLENIEDFFGYLKNYFGNIYLITHIQDVKYKVDKIINLEKIKDKSYINNSNETNLIMMKDLKKIII